MVDIERGAYICYKGDLLGGTLLSGTHSNEERELVCSFFNLFDMILVYVEVFTS